MFEWTERQYDAINARTMEAFHSKVNLSDLLYFPIHQAPYNFLFNKAEPGFVVTLLEERSRYSSQQKIVVMSYCPTKHELREFVIGLYPNSIYEWEYMALKGLKAQIEDHFSSTNVHDACCKT